MKRTSEGGSAKRAGMNVSRRKFPGRAAATGGAALITATASARAMAGGVLLIHEVFGLKDHSKSIADRLDQTAGLAVEEY